MPLKRKPVELRILDGTYKPSIHGPRPEDLEPVGEPIQKPLGLPREVGLMWEKVFPLLKPVARTGDVPMIVELCFVWCELRRCQRALKKTVPGARGYNQLLVGMGICFYKVDKLAARFGMTPSDRAKLRFEQCVPVKAKVPTRPRTKLDAAGKPG